MCLMRNESQESSAGQAAPFDREAMSPKLKRLVEENIFIGTSSWKYEGWLGRLYSPERYEYRGKVARKRFEQDCLEEYAEVFPTVCLDAAFYNFPRTSYLEKLGSQVPEGFRFGMKVTEEITVKHFPNLSRHGKRAGRENENFLNADLFERAFLVPCSAIREKVGVLIFEFSTFYPRDFARGRDFVERLEAFLAALPTGWQYGVEIRNRNFLEAPYFEMLSRYGVAHVFNAWTRMPTVSEQMEMSGAFTTDFHAARFLLKSGRKYADAVDQFSPYERVQEGVPEARAALGKLAKRSSGRPSYLFVNNRLEGNALDTIAASLV